MIENRGFIYSIVHLRTISALAVLIGHLLYSQENFFPGQGLIPPIYAIWAVDLFFVISGFIMMHVSFSIPQGSAEAKAFWYKRLVRMLPPYWVSTVAAFVLMGFYFSHKGIVQEFSADVLLKGLDSLLHSLLLIEYRAFPVNNVGWTLQYEVIFYVLCALAVWLLPSNRRAYIISAVILLAVVIGQLFAPEKTYAHYITKPVLLEFIGGALLAQYYHHYWLKQGAPRYWFAPLLVVTGIAAIVLSAMNYPENYLHINRWFFCGVPVLMIMAGMIFILPPNWKGPSWSLWFGEASYSFYLWHLPVYQFSALLVMMLMPETSNQVAWFLLVSTLLVVPVSAVSYYLLEMRLSRFLRHKLLKTSSPSLMNPVSLNAASKAVSK